MCTLMRMGVSYVVGSAMYVVVAILSMADMVSLARFN